MTSRSGNAVLRADRVEWAEETTLGPELVLVEKEREQERRQDRAAQPEQLIKLLVLAGYAAVVALGIAWHEPWADEGQAWLLARDQGFWHLMLHSLRYEGSPGLWHALLWVLVRGHVGYAGMHWVSGVIAVGGIYVFLRWSPFPLILNILLPFGFWLAYQDAVVARGYVLYAILAFTAAAILRGMIPEYEPADRGRLICLGVLLGLMANLSVHGFVASVGFAVVALAALRRKARAGFPVRKAMAAVLLCCFWLLAVVTAFPPSDIDYILDRNPQHTAEKIWARLGNQDAKKQLAAKEGTDVRPGELTPLPPVELHHTARERNWRKVARLLATLTFPVSNYRYLALGCVVLAMAMAIVFSRRRGGLGWVGLMPWVLMVVLFRMIDNGPRHAGMLWESLLAGLWLTWPLDAPRGARLWLQRVMLAVLVVVALSQAWWTAHAVWGDVHGPYSGDVEMAKFLRSQGPDKKIAGFSYHSVGTAALFDHRIYFNQPTAYWIWSRNVRINQEAQQTIARHPDIIDVGGYELSERNGNITDDWIRPDPRELHEAPLNEVFGIIPWAEVHGYRETHRFCGHAFMRDGYSELECQVALQPVQSAGRQ